MKKIIFVTLILVIVLASSVAAEPIRWRLQSYAGPALNQHVCKNAIDEFNIAANGEMFIEVYTADQLVPQGELFRHYRREQLTQSVATMTQWRLL